MSEKIPIYGPEIIWYEDIEKERQVERKTYLKGQLTAKYYGNIETRLSEEYERSQFYTYKLYEANIVIGQKGIRKSGEKPFQIASAITVSEDFLPENTSIKIIKDKVEVFYKANLRGVIINKPEFLSDLIQIEGEEIFGVLKAEITGYLVDIVTEKYIDTEERSKREIIGWRTIKDPEPKKCIQGNPTGNSEIKINGTKEYIRFEYYNADCTTYWSDWQFKQCVEGSFTGKYELKSTKSKNYARYQFYKSDCTTYWGKWEIKGCIQDEQTGKFEVKDGWWLKRYIRYEYYKSDCTTYWGKWIFKEKIDLEFDPNLGKILLWLIALIFACLWVYFIGIKSLLLFGLIGVILYGIVSKFEFFYSIFKWGIRLISLLFVLGMLSVFLNYFKHGFKNNEIPTRNNYTHTDKEIEKTDTLNDLIVHHRLWNDYAQNNYACDLKIHYSDYLNSSNFNTSQISARNLKDVYSSLKQFDENSLNLIYQEFDSLRIANNYSNNSPQLANMLVSCIQDIPYVLILDRSCNIRDNDDNSVRELLTSGCDCKGFVPNGVQSPIEFMYDLKGDCDTRSLLLFVLLKKFGYKTLLLASEYYKHAIIAVNLPDKGSDGIKFKYNNENYSVWETTAPGLPAGVLSPEVDNMNLWSIYLK